MQQVATLREAVCDAYEAERKTALLEAKGGNISDPVLVPSDPFGGDWLPARTSFLPFASPAAMRCVEGSERMTFVDALLHKFLVARGFDVTSAAARFLAFRRLVLEHGLSFVLDDEIRLCLRQGLFHFLPLHVDPQQFRPIMAVTPRRLDWSTVTVQKMKKAWFFVAMTVLSLAPTAQDRGIILTNSVKGAGPSNIKVEFMKFMLGAVRHAMPVKLGAGFIANQPKAFQWIIWPIFRQLMSEKMRERMHIIGDCYTEAVDFCGRNVVPEEMGGGRVIDTAQEIQLQLQLVEIVSRAALSGEYCDSVVVPYCRPVPWETRWRLCAFCGFSHARFKQS